MPDFQKAFNEVLGFEGGYSNDAADRGGKTRYGITEETARAAGYTGDMTILPLAIAASIYKHNYWDTLKLDFIISQEVGNAIFDISVNMGVGTAAYMTQAAVNYLNRNGVSWPEIAEDGIVGPDTIEKINKLNAQDTEAYIKLLNLQQGARYIEIIKANKSQRVFIRGWIKRT